jgi:hypothetical protein
VTVRFRNGFYAGLLVAFVVGLYLASLWAAERQVQLHSEHLVAAIEKRDAADVAAFIDESYRDDWGDDRELLLQRVRALLQLLRNIHVNATAPAIAVTGGEGRWTARVTITADGEFAPAVSERVNAVTTPFELFWRKRSWKPWDWKLVRVANPTLEIPRGLD